MEILTSPILWQGMGFTVASGIFISSIFYNGDYSKPIRALIVLGICSFFTISIMSASNFSNTKELIGVTTIINACFVIGLYLGVWVYNTKIRKDNCK